VEDNGFLLLDFVRSPRVFHFRAVPTATAGLRGFVFDIRKIRVGKMKRQHQEIFLKIRLYGAEIASTAVFLVFLYVAARYEIAHLLAR